MLSIRWIVCRGIVSLLLLFVAPLSLVAAPVSTEDASATIEGTVDDAAGTPLADIAVTADAGAAAACSSATTNADGFYSIGCAFEGEASSASVTVTAAGVAQAQGIDAGGSYALDFILPQPATRVALYRYYHARLGRHFYTTNWDELGSGRNGWQLEHVQAYVYPQQEPGTVPLYRYYAPRYYDHFYTTNYGEVGGGNGVYQFQHIQAYVYPAQAPGTVPLYRYYHPRTIGHFYTTNFNELGSGRDGWVLEAIQAYVYP